MTLAMTCLEIIGLKADLQAITDTLRRLGCVHIDNLSETPELSARPLTLDAETLRAQESLTALAAQIDGLLEALGGPQAEMTQERSDQEDDLDAIAASVTALTPEVQKLTAHRDRLKADADALPRYEATLRRLLPIVPPSASDPRNTMVALLISRVHMGVLDAVEKEVIALTSGRVETAGTDVDGLTHAMVFVFPSEFNRPIEELLGREDISRLRLPAELGQGLPESTLNVLRGRLAAIPEESAQVDRELAELAGKWKARLSAWREALREKLATYTVYSRFGETDMTFVLAGWVPTVDVARVKAALTEASRGRVIVQEIPLTHDLMKRAPVALNNPPVAQPFESLVTLLALPRYGGVDPTRLMALFLPIFFGMMLGDVGYGLLLLLISLGLVSKFRTGMARSISIVLAMGSAWGILFGFLYGEAFGTLGEEFGLHAIWLDRTSPEHVTALLLTTVGIGAAHITLGLVLGVWEAVRERSRNLLLERSGMLIGLIGLFLLVGTLVNILPRGAMTPAIAGVIVGIVLLGAPMGWLGILVGPIEFIGLLGNVLSYLRIAAIGLASVYLAKVANDMAGMIGNVVVGVILAVLIHALNLVMGTFSPTIHSLRLHYVEFFRKFYEGGGKAYEPFGAQPGHKL
jgi:V/A-type H+-transporting ATPase subunit I